MFRKIKNHLIPHKGNNYRPYLFAVESVTAVIALLAVLQVAYIAHVALVRHSDFLASVLPVALVTMTNSDRVANGLAELKYDPMLAQAAQLKANDMAKNGYFSHQSPDGRQPWAWLDLIGYKYKRAGENLAIDFSESSDVERAWMNSPTHRANLLKDKFTHIGIATAVGEYEGRETTFVVQFFAQKQAPVKALAKKKLALAKSDSPAKKIETKKSKVNIEPKDKKKEDKNDKTQENAKVPASSNESLDEKEYRVLGAETFVKEKQNSVSAENKILRNIKNSEKNVDPLKIDELISEVEQAKETVASMHLEDKNGKLAEVLTSPSYVFIPIFLVIFIIVFFALAVAIFTHIQVRYVEALEGGALLLVVAGAFLYMQFYSADIVRLPQDTQSAAVVRSLSE